MISELYALSSDLQAAIAAAPKLATPPKRDGKIATFFVEGILSRGGENGTSTDKLTADINAAAADQSVSKIELLISSPGGKVPGILEAFNAVANAAKQKFVAAYCRDVVASGAYFIGCGANSLTTDPLCVVGSLGTYTTLIDSSGLANSIGVKTIVVRAGEFKGMGTPGTEVTAQMLAEIQRRVDSVNEHFINAVAAGRRLPMDRVRALFDGRVYVGAEAKTIGLTDGTISTYDHFAAQLRAAFSTPQAKEQHSMAFSNERSKGSVATSEFYDLVEAKMAAGMNRAKAIEATVIAEPKTHQAFLAEVNAHLHR